MLKFWRMRHGRQKLAVRGATNDIKNPQARLARLKQCGFLLVAVERGEALVDLHSGSIRLSEGDALLLTALEAFNFSTIGDTTSIWVEAPIWWLIELCHGKIVGARRRLDHRLQVTVILRRTLAALLEAASGQQDDMVDMFGDVLARNLMIATYNEEQFEGQIDRIQRYIALNYKSEKLSPQDAASALGCSLSTIHKTCASTGLTFGRMVLSMRLSVAAYRLGRKPELISAVAYDCGFSSLSHFCHAFKAYYGVTARDVRGRHAAHAPAESMSDLSQ
jgi:AraC-like DNA-binding protein